MKSEKFLKYNYLFASWFFTENIIVLFSKILGVGIQKVWVSSGFEIVIEISSKLIYPVIYFLNKHSLSCFKSLIDIVCYDTPASSFRFSLVYNLLSIQYNFRCQVLTKIQELTNVFSIMGIYKSGNWSEREIFDFFGIFFLVNKDLRRILTDYGFQGFPLRKDFPLTGYVDIYYDDNQKRICYRNLELTQEYRNFDFKNTWI